MTRDDTTRLDVALVAAGLARSRGHARDLVAAGAVRVDGATAAKASRPVGPGHRIDVEVTGAWVGRAALKLVGAFEAFGPRGLHVRGRRCVDVGASTGGFTQVLLDRGAASVLALDVGHGQLAPVVRDDPRVVDASGTSIRTADPRVLGGPFEILVADLSFISLTLVADRLRAFLADPGQGVLLVKPQFEVGRAALPSSGVVADPRARDRAVRSVGGALARAGLSVLDAAPSPTPGGAGNREYLLWVSGSPAVGLTGRELADRVGRIINEEDAS